MEENYNDNELSDIMKAIEELENESDLSLDEPENKLNDNHVSTSSESLDSQENDQSHVSLNVESQKVAESREVKSEKKDPSSEVSKVSQLVESHEHISSDVTEDAGFTEDSLEDELKNTLREVEEISKNTQSEIISHQVRDDNTDKNNRAVEKSVSMKKETFSGASRIDFNIKEGVHLDLFFQFGQDVISFSVSNDGIEVFLEDGMSFKIPRLKNQNNSKAA